MWRASLAVMLCIRQHASACVSIRYGALCYAVLPASDALLMWRASLAVVALLLTAVLCCLFKLFKSLFKLFKSLRGMRPYIGSTDMCAGRLSSFGLAPHLIYVLPL
jgi:hypothetical protein